MSTELPMYYHVTELARRLGTAIVVFDLEATTFRGRPNFGITEVACFIVQPSGPGLAIQSLINPERLIDSRVEELTGIRNKDVKNAELWGKRYAGLFAQMAKDQWITGFGNQAFDEPAVIEMNARYGVPIEKFEKTFDVRRLHLSLSNATSQKGTLSSVGALYGIKPKGNLHRAYADVILTLETLHAIIGVYGIEAVLAHILPAPEGAVDKLTCKALAKYVKSKKSISVEEVAQAFCKDIGTTSAEIGRAIDDRLINPNVFASQSAQDWLESALMEVRFELLEQPRLSLLHESLLTQGPPTGQLDYIQLRVALSRAQLSWNSLKPLSD